MLRDACRSWYGSRGTDNSGKDSDCVDDVLLSWRAKGSGAE
jgi:hypothetical protein